MEKSIKKFMILFVLFVLMIQITSVVSADKNVTNITGEDAVVSYADDISLSYNVTNGTTSNITSGVLNLTVLDSKNNTAYKTNGTISNGRVSITIPKGELSVGNYTLVAYYAGTETQSNATAINHLTINKADSKLEINVSDINYGESTLLNITAVPSVISGYINITTSEGNSYKFKGDLAIDENGTGLLKIVISDDYIIPFNVTNNTVNLTQYGYLVPAGKYNITVDYWDYMSQYKAGTTKANLTVRQIETDLNVDVSGVSYADKTNITVALNPLATGNVTISVNGSSKKFNKTVDIVNGTATYIIPQHLDLGLYNVSVIYSGDRNFNAASNKTNFTIVKAIPEIDVKVDGTTYGENTTLFISVGKDGENATGNVTVEVVNETFNKTLINGTTTIELGKLAIGDYSVKVTYNSTDDRFSNTILSQPFAVKKVTNVYVNTSDITYGENATVTVKVDKNVTGNVTVTIDGINYQATKDLVNGSAIFNIGKVTTSGTFEVVATYNGNSEFHKATNTTNLTVSKIDTNLTNFYEVVNGSLIIGYVINQNITGENLTVTITGPNNFTKTCDMLITNGKTGLWSIGLGSDGLYTINAVFKGTSMYAACSDVSNVTYTNVCKLTADNVTKIFGNGTNYSVKLTDSTGRTVANATIKLTFTNVKTGTSKEYLRVTDANGVATLGIGANPGNYIIVAEYVNGTADKITNTVTVLPADYSLQAKDVIKYYKNGTQYYVKVLDENGAAVANVRVMLTITSESWTKSVSYYKVTDENGTATLDINLAAGVYTITATIPTVSSGASKSNNIAVFPTLTAYGMTKKVSQPATFTARVVDGQGNPLAGKEVTVTIKVKVYHLTTDANGIASLDINLGVGTWSLLVSSADAGMSTRATVKVTK